MSSVLQSRRSLYVGGLADDVGENTLRAAMIPFGPVKSIEMVRVFTATCIATLHLYILFRRGGGIVYVMLVLR